MKIEREEGALEGEWVMERERGRESCFVRMSAGWKEREREGSEGAMERELWFALEGEVIRDVLWVREGEGGRVRMREGC